MADMAEKNMALEFAMRAGGIGHDLNNILTVIQNNIVLARMSSKPGDAVYKKLTDVEDKFLQARHLTQQLMTFSKDKASEKREIITVADVLKDTVKFALSDSGVTCRFYIPKDLWAVKADEGQISQVINNIVINAKQSMPEGGTIRIAIKNIAIKKGDAMPLREGNYVKVTIQDEGKGIPKDHLQKIFDPFFTTKKRGSGLGLATSKSIIEKHEGHIEVESKMDVGTSFYIFLKAKH
jgi:signal transduction histidine kinase